MSLVGVEGTAGTGKTYRLMELLAERLAKTPLAGGQRVLALTFMHGSRRRLSQQLSTVRNLGSRFDCLTFDGFAHHLLRRWARLASALSIPSPGTFDEQCEAAALLLEDDNVRAWVAASYPTLIVDEAQDLDGRRLRILRALSRSLEVFAAADEFQCLNTSLLPAPAVAWLRSSCRMEVLTIARRTSRSELLVAAANIRESVKPRSGGCFQLLGSKGDGMSAAHLARVLSVGATGDVAIITPSKKSGWAAKLVEMIGSKPYGKKKFGPHTVRWERSDIEDADAAITSMQLADASGFDETLRALRSLPDTAPVRATVRWLHTRRNAFGVELFSRTDVLESFRRHVYLNSRYVRADNQMGFGAMTVHQAKNREFNGVVVLWPYAVGGNDDGKRRLLYNAVTRAKLWCSVIVQNESLLATPPFC